MKEAGGISFGDSVKDFARKCKGKQGRARLAAAVGILAMLLIPVSYTHLPAVKALFQRCSFGKRAQLVQQNDLRRKRAPVSYTHLPGQNRPFGQKRCL